MYKTHQEGEYTIKVYDDGEKHWYKEGKLHREDGPAVEYADGDKKWYKEGMCHREDGPAVEYANGTKYWFLNGKIYNVNSVDELIIAMIIE